MRHLSIFIVLAAASILSSPAADRLTRFDQINALPFVNQSLPIPFEITGQVISKHHIRTANRHVRVLTLVDRSQRIHISTPTDTCDWQVGDIVHACGHVNRCTGSVSNGVFATQIEKVGHRPLPSTVPFGMLEAASSTDAVLPVHINGTVTDVFLDDLSDHFFWIILETRLGPVNAYASSDEHSYHDFQRLVDAEIEMRGLYSLTANHWRTTKNTLQIFGVDGYSITKPAPADPFLAPAFPHDSPHRLLLTGIVRGMPRDGLFVTSSEGIFIHVHLATPSDGIQVGDTVKVVGFPRHNRFGFHFHQSLVMKTGRSDLPPEQPITISGALLSSDPIGKEPVNYRYHGKTIRIKGLLRDRQNSDNIARILRIDSDQQEVEVDYATAFTDAAPDFQHGSEIEVTGICSVEFEDSGAGQTIPRFRRYLITPRTPEDIVLVRGPQWWTPAKLLFVIALLFALLIVISIWNKLLKIHAERRGQELATEKIAHTQAEIKVEERTRLAVELHDSLSQIITGVAFHIDTAIAANSGHSVEIDDILNTARQMLASCRKALQCCLWDLRCRTFEEADLTEAIRKAIEPHVGTLRTQIRFNVPRDTLSESATHTILKIVRELVVNAIRHGKATEIKIAGEFHNSIVNFSVRDNGIGFSPESAAGPRQGHFGLQGVRERLRACGGTIEIHSAPGQGARFIVSLPVTQDDLA